MTAAVTPTSDRQKLFKAVKYGTGIMLLQMPCVTSLNRISVVSCYRGCSMIKAIKKIYHGNIDFVEKAALEIKPSWKHFFKGVSGHLVKESMRIWFKASGLFFKPRLEEYFRNSPQGKLKSDLTFAGSLSFLEMAINPSDTLRTMWQAGEKLSDVPKGKKMRHLYKGSGANGLRQFGTWYVFTRYNDRWSKWVQRAFGLNPHAMSGIVAKSLPQSIQFTAPIWMFERLKNELQYHPKLHETGGKRVYRYAAAVQHIIRTQGILGFWRGFAPKVWSNTVLVIGANYLIELGRKAQKR